MKLKRHTLVKELIKFISFSCLMLINSIAYSIEIVFDSGINHEDSLIICDYFNKSPLGDLDDVSILLVHHFNRYLYEDYHLEVDFSKDEINICNNYSIELSNKSKTKAIKGVIYNGTVLINVFDWTKFKYSNFYDLDLGSVTHKLLLEHKISRKYVFFEESKRKVNSIIEFTYFNTEHFLDYGIYTVNSKHLYIDLNSEKIKDYFPVIMIKTNSSKKFNNKGKFGGVEYFIFNENFELVQHGVYSELIDGIW